MAAITKVVDYLNKVAPSVVDYLNKVVLSAEEDKYVWPHSITGISLLVVFGNFLDASSLNFFCLEFIS